MTGMVGPDCAVMCNLTNTHTHKVETGKGAGTERRQEREQGWRPVDEHKMGTGTRAGTETRAVAETGTGTRAAVGTRTRSRRVEERRCGTRGRLG